LLGRIVFVTALRHPVPRSTLARTLLDVAVAAMAISIAVEIAQLGLTSTAAWLAESGTGADTIVAVRGPSSSRSSLGHRRVGPGELNRDPG
jgi:hypothetical protein